LPVHLHGEDVFEHLIEAEEFAKLVSHSGEKLMDVQRITSFPDPKLSVLVLLCHKQSSFRILFI